MNKYRMLAESTVAERFVLAVELEESGALKTCRVCSVEQPITDFYRHPYGRDGHESRCKRCNKARPPSPPNPAAKRRRRLHHLYGLSVEEFEALLEAQGNACAICRESFVDQEWRRGKAVDHDHATGTVRGLLCPNCNRLLGMAHDNPEVLKAAINYLRNNGGSF